MTRGRVRGTVSGYPRGPQADRPARPLRSKPSHSTDLKGMPARRISLIIQHSAVNPFTLECESSGPQKPRIRQPRLPGPEGREVLPGRRRTRPASAGRPSTRPRSTRARMPPPRRTWRACTPPLAAGAIETDRMTVEDTVWKTVGLFAVLLVTAVGGWIWTMAPVTAQNPSPNIAPWIIGMLGGFVLVAGRHLRVAQEGPPRADLRLRSLRGTLRRRHLRVLRVHLARASSSRRPSRRSRSSVSPSPCSRAARSARRSGPRRSS